MQSLITGLLFPVIGLTKCRARMEDSFMAVPLRSTNSGSSKPGTLAKIELALGIRKGQAGTQARKIRPKC